MARRKIGGADKIDFSGLPDLTERQMDFVKGVLDGLTGSDAYRKAYGTENMQPNTIWASASRLRSDPKVAAWLATARKAQMGHSRITLEQHVQRLDELKQVALETGNVGAAVQAEQIIGKVMGHHVERFEDVTRSDALSILNELNRLSPLAAKALAEEHGIKQPDESLH